MKPMATKNNCPIATKDFAVIRKCDVATINKTRIDGTETNEKTNKSKTDTSKARVAYLRIFAPD